ncbi:Glutathione synthetase [Umbelopsis nana]
MAGSYPPILSQQDLHTLRDTAIDYALANGLIVRPTVDKQVHFANNAAVTHAPFSLFPTPFPRREFIKAQKLQPIWNDLIHRMSQDDAFLNEIMDTLREVDDFMEKLYDIYKKVKSEGIKQKASLGIHRCDYLLHVPEGGKSEDSIIQQVEFNTIASSFGGLSAITGDLHQFLLRSTDYQCDPNTIKLNQLPENISVTAIAGGIAAAYSLYNVPGSVVLMVIQPGERNAFDQRSIEYELLKKHNVRLIRRTLSEIEERGQLDSERGALLIDGREIAVTYFRAGYSPDDHPTDKEWEARLLVERSLSIKCPNIAYQLVGAKKVQQVLAIPGRIEKYLDENVANEVRESFAGLYPLDHTEIGQQAYQMALANPGKYVMKPQREGGGNNLYGNDIVTELKRLEGKRLDAYILMDLIRSPPLKNIMVREGLLIQGDVISELGIYGTYLHDGKKEILNEPAGHLLRTKGHGTNEGGVAAGFAVIDSPLLL